MPKRLPLLVLLICASVLAPAAAQARGVVVATGDANATLTDVSTSRIVARVPVGGRSRAAAVAPDGSRGYRAAGSRGGASAPTPPRGSAAGQRGGGPAGRAVSADGARLYASRRGAVDV